VRDLVESNKLEEVSAGMTGSGKTSKTHAIGLISQYLTAMQVKHVVNDTVDGKVVDLHLPEQ
jgi:hypothetical protein